MAFVKVGEMLSDFSRLSRESESLQATFFLDQVNIYTHIFFSDRAKKNIHATRYKKGIVTFSVISNVWAQELKMHETHLLKYLKSNIPKIVLSRIVIKISTTL